MTVEERFERIEHITAGLVEQSRKDREENRQLWRDTQRQISELTFKIADTNDAIVRLSDRVDRFVEETSIAHRELRAADEALGQRIDSLVSAIGQLISKQ